MSDDTIRHTTTALAAVLIAITWACCVVNMPREGMPLVLVCHESCLSGPTK